MDLTGVVPVAVPLEPGDPTQITVPRDTHIMYWCALQPLPYPPFDKDMSATARELLAFQRRLLRRSELTVCIDGEPIPLLDEVHSGYGIEYWTLRDPLSKGSHTLDISISYEESAGNSTETGKTSLPKETPPPTYTLPTKTMIPWGNSTESTTRSELIVADEPPTEARKEPDPLWETRDVYSPYKYEEVKPAK
ncbi:hypothetical protein [Halobellus salinisoli]|uniref:hypothetical protein n=1 Tax=Halobellus salinisoli TaxID=3108500 RepID=UPI00300B98E1